MQGHIRTGDGSGAGPAVGLQHITVEPDGPLAELRHVDHSPERTPNEPLNFLRASTETAPRCLAHVARTGRPGQHAILGSHPTSPTTTPEGRDTLFHRGRT